jgi:hypothetical protein
MQILSEAGTFITAELGGGIDSRVPGSGPAVTARGTPDEPDANGPWQQWQQNTNDDGTVSFTCWDGHFLTAELGGGSTLSTDRDENGPWQRFRLVGPLIQCWDGVHYLKVRTDLGPVAVVDATGTAQGMRFRLLNSRTTRHGIVRLAARTFVDDDGPYLAVGASLFWAVYGYQHDRARLEQNLAFLADHGVDYVRVFAAVGPNGWTDRTVDPREAGWDAAITGTTDLIAAHGLRVEWTIFASIDTLPTVANRRAVVDRFLAAIRGHEAAVQHIELANEFFAIYRVDNAIRELRELARHVVERTAVLVAISAPADLGDGAVALYRGSAAQVMTAHLDRNVSGEGRLWRPARQARDPMLVWPGAWTSNEPIGPQSSVAADDDPTRLTMSAALTWLCNGAGYVLHTGAGVRGGGREDIARGRVANVWEVAHIEETLAGIAAVRKLLPADLPNWTFQNANRTFPRHPFDTNPLASLIVSGRLLRAFAATAGDGRFVVMPIVAEAPIPFTATFAMQFDVHDPLTGAVRESRELAARETYTMPPTPAAVMIGTMKAS